MADVFSILASNYTTVGQNVNLNTGKYVNVDPKAFEGTWSGKYANQKPFSVTVSNVNGFRAKAKYQYGSTVKYQDVLIKNNAFRVGDSKFTLTKAGTAQVNTVMTNPVTGASTLETAYVHQN
ncbi:hypothetical protein [Nitrobacter sp.]|jgi:hypothetical protein|uniref:hypothetical protein n=1 Tax=Nitrobacter sp. TaxID=29420 RepID=UPI003F64E04B